MKLTMELYIELIFLIVSLFARIDCLTITKMTVPKYVQNGTEDSVVLDCEYEYEKKKDGPLIVKWFHEDDPTAVYQWIVEFDTIRSSEKFRVNRDFEISSGDRYTKHRALNIMKLTTDLSGKYSCVIASVNGYDIKTDVMIVYAHPTNIILNYTIINHIVYVKCLVENVYPIPKMELFQTAPGKIEATPIENVNLYPTLLDASYDVVLTSIMTEEELDTGTPRYFECVVSIEGTTYKETKEVPYFPVEKESHIVGIVGDSADLPCDVDESSCGKVYFITWTKKNIQSGEWKWIFISSDAVEKPLQELANPDRAVFYLRASSAHLRISPLRIEDDGVYKCDVTYAQGKCSSLSFASLIMHAKPSKPVIEENGTFVLDGSEVGPFLEGHSASFECETSGGKPTPEVTWFKGDKELDSDSKVTVEKNGASSVVSTVRLTFDRGDIGSNIECRADNEAIDEPLVTYVKVNLHVGPSRLEITGPEHAVTEGDLVTFTCVVEGAKPAADIMWLNKSTAFNDSIETKIEEDDHGTFRTVSTLKTHVTSHDHEGTFYCQGTNSVLQSKEREGVGVLLNSTALQVLFAPDITMKPESGALVNERETAYKIGARNDAIVPSTFLCSTYFFILSFFFGTTT